jgi:DNA repair exonuclease SbcCD ATPase subunit
MNVFTELIKWIDEKKVPYWEQYALDLIISGKGIAESEIKEMATFLLEDGGVIKKEATRPKLSALLKAVGTSAHQTSEKVRLKGISSTENINALVDDQKLEFGDQLTVIFGANGSGKSGYARLLANASFSRGDREVLPHVTTEGAESALKQAVFHIERNGEVEEVSFVEDEGCPHLRSFYVHDTVSILAQLTQENEFSFAPFGLGFLARLAEVSDMVGDQLEAQIDQWSKDREFEAKLEGSSEIRTTLETLSAGTDVPALSAKAVILPEEQRQKEAFQIKVAKLRARSVPEEIKKRSKQVEDLNTLLGQLRTMINGLGLPMARSIETDLVDLRKYQDQAKKLSVDQFKTTLFTQIGSEQWQRFISSAHALSKVERENPPYPEGGDYCLLCRQKLEKAAVELLQKYWKYLENDFRQQIRTIRSRLSAKREALQDTETICFAENTVAYRLIQKADEELFNRLKHFIQSAKDRKNELIRMIDLGKQVELTPLDGLPIPSVRAIIDPLNTQIAELQKTDPTKEITTLEGQLRLLNHREKMGQMITAVAAYVSDLKKASKAEQLKPNTAHISKIQGKLFETLVSAEYVKRFRDTLAELGNALPVRVHTKNNKGTTIKELCIYAGEYGPAKILSDGEKRIASLADFLTEVSLDPKAIGIALDDPVTSLDIEWKGTVANRLVKESQTRQTIIFTHDLHFRLC